MCDANITGESTAGEEENTEYVSCVSFGMLPPGFILQHFAQEHAILIHFQIYFEFFLNQAVLFNDKDIATNIRFFII